MDDKSQKERLEQELRFLKESFDAEVISKEEYEKGKDRVERKLNEIHSSSKENNAEDKKNEPISQNIGPKSEKPEEPIAEKEDNGKIRLRVIQDDVDEHMHEHALPGHDFGEAEKKDEQKEHFKEIKPNVGHEKEGSKALKYGVVFVVLVLAVFFMYSFMKSGPKISESSTLAEQLIIECTSDFNCVQEGKEGICLSAGTKEAKCEFREIQKTSVTVLNDRKACFNCGTQRALSILESWFGSLDAKEISYSSKEGKELAEKIGAGLLPAYVLDGSIEKKPKFEEFKRVFAKKGSVYVLSDDVAGSSFYFRREIMPNRLDLLVIPGDASSLKAENNLKEFLGSFKEVKFQKHASDSALAKELGIKAFPVFLVNNQVKFGGVHAAETIKANFCSINKVSGCEKTLSSRLV